MLWALIFAGLAFVWCALEVRALRRAMRPPEQPRPTRRVPAKRS